MLINPQRQVSPKSFQVRYRTAPLKGMNTYEPVTALDQGYATRLDNWICRADGLHLRPGFTVTESASGAVTSLMAFGPHAVARRDGDWIGAVVSNPGGRHLFGAKGGVAPEIWDGSAWRPASISGVAPVALLAPALHGRRVFAIESNSLTIWYLGLDAIGGEARPIYVGPVTKHGGHLVSIGSDGQRLAAVTSEGELVLYQGRNPDVAGEGWAHAGTFLMPKPVGGRALSRVGDALVLLTESGALPVPAAAAKDQAAKEVEAITRAIEPTYASHGATQLIDSGSQNFRMIAGSDGELVQASETGGWSRTLGYGATCWVETSDALYFGRTDGTVCKVGGTTQPDVNGPSPIAAIMVDSFSKFGAAGRKRFLRVRPQFKLAHPYRSRVSMVVDYRDPPEAWAAAHAVSRYWDWADVTYEMMPALWEKPTSHRLGPWRGVAGNGEAGAMIMSASAVDGNVVFIGSDYTFERGGAF